MDTQELSKLLSREPFEQMAIRSTSSVLKDSVSEIPVLIKGGQWESSTGTAP